MSLYTTIPPCQAAGVPSTADDGAVRRVRFPQHLRDVLGQLAAGHRGQLPDGQHLPQLHARCRRPQQHRLLPPARENKGIASKDDNLMASWPHFKILVRHLVRQTSKVCQGL